MAKVDLTDEAWAMFEEEAKKRNETVQELFDKQITPYLREKFAR
jgi:hypothetical protein